MKSREEIEEKISKMKKGLENYVEMWEKDIHFGIINGVPVMIHEDINYNIIKNQIEALEWVLKETRRK